MSRALGDVAYDSRETLSLVRLVVRSCLRGWCGVWRVRSCDVRRLVRPARDIRRIAQIPGRMGGRIGHRCVGSGGSGPKVRAGKPASQAGIH